MLQPDLKQHGWQGIARTQIHFDMHATANIPQNIARDPIKLSSLIALYHGYVPRPDGGTFSVTLKGRPDQYNSVETSSKGMKNIALYSLVKGKTSKVHSEILSDAGFDRRCHMTLSLEETLHLNGQTQDWDKARWLPFKVQTDRREPSKGWILEVEAQSILQAVISMPVSPWASCMKQEMIRIPAVS